MKTKLITALRLTANALENHTFAYEWNSNARCNCGALVCALKGYTPGQLLHELTAAGAESPTNWTQMTGLFCPISGTPTNDLFNELIEYGLRPEDIVQLENLSNPRVLARMNRPKRRLFGLLPPLRRVFYDDRKRAAAYMRAWADILTEDGALDVPEQQTSEVRDEVGCQR